MLTASRLGSEQGIALVTTIVLTVVMLVLGTAVLGVVVTQAEQTSNERGGEQAFNLAEAALNGEAFLLGRNWPSTAVAGTCDANTLSGTLASPATSPSPTLTEQMQSILAQTHAGSANPTTSRWYVTACAEGGRNSWDATLLDGAAYDTDAALSGPRRMWVRAEAEVNGRRRAVVGLVQAGKQPVFPSNLAVVAGKMGGNLTTTSGQLLTGNVVGPLLTTLTGGSNGKVIDGTVGLRCSVLDTGLTGVTDCLSGIYKATSMTTVAPLLHANNFVDFRSDTTISAEQTALLRQQAKSTDTYYPNSTTVAGGGGVANGASCLPTSPTPAGKVIFIEQVGDGTGHCIIDTSTNPSAAAVVVGSGGVRVCSNATCATATSGGTYTGVIYALHRKAPLQSSWADVRIEGGSKVVGGVFTDDDSSPDAAHQHGFVEVIPPAIDMTAVVNSITSTLPLCQPVLGIVPITCSLTTLLGGTLDELLSTLGISPATLAAAMVTQLNASLPAITYNAAAVQAVTTMGDSALVPGTFREVAPKF